VPELSVQHVSKRLGENQVVNDVSFAVADGEFFVLLGPSGGGKSTLLRLICGLEMPDSGEIIVGGRDVTRKPPRERNLGMVFQDYGLYPNMNVFDNIAYGLQARSVAQAEITKRVTAAAERLGLSDKLKRSVVDLSGGEQQRVALARAMAKDAEAFLFDEPLSNLDPKLRHQARRDIVNLHRVKQRPSVYVTHDQTEAFAMGDRIAVIGQGRLQQVGTAEELLNEPANIFIARFVGTPPMNLLWGTVKRVNGGYHFFGDGVELSLSDTLNVALDRRADPRVVLGFRPDALMLIDDSLADTYTSFVARVEDVDALIGETVASLAVGAKSTLAAVLSDDVPLRPGQNLRFAVEIARLRLFDPDSEQAIG
jgi:ABC-type sugar transport system ATPase subunit